MALKADRQVDASELGYFLNEVTDNGGMVSVSTATSGASLDSTDNVATVAAASSGQHPLGMLLTEFVDLDLTRVPVNWHKEQANTGDKASIMTKGWVVTDQVVAPVTAGNDAVLVSSGSVSDKPTDGSWNSVANPFVGRFRSGTDESGFARLYVDL